MTDTPIEIGNRPIDGLEIELTERLTDLSGVVVDERGAPVADAEGRLVGVVSVVDIADLVSDDAEIAADRSEPDFLYRGREATLTEDELEELEIDDEDLTVADIMTPEIHSVAPSAPVSEIAMKMLREHLHRVLVLDPDDRCVGIVTTSDLLGLLVEEGP